MQDAKFVSYNDSKYVIFSVYYKNNLKLPALLDYDVYKILYKANKRWRCNENGFVVCSHTVNGITKDVPLHELVMLVHNERGGKVLHINRIGLDNRKENLAFMDSNINKNIKKKKRTVILPKDSGINPDSIPTYIWYVKPRENHGDMFTVRIGDVTYNTTSSKYISLNDKLLEAKGFLKHLFQERGDLRAKYSMNGDYNAWGKDLLHSYYDIAKKAGYNNLEKHIPEHNTNKLLTGK